MRAIERVLTRAGHPSPDFIISGCIKGGKNRVDMAC